MSKITDFYTHKAALLEKGEPIDPQWKLLEDKLLKEELLPELIVMLNASADYVVENDRKHHSMSAALNQYLLYFEEWESRRKEIR